MRERLRSAAPLVSLAVLGRDRGRDRRDRTASTARTESTSTSNTAANRSASAPLPPLALWYTEAPRAVPPAAGGAGGLFSSLAELLGLWHEMRRGSHNGAHDTDTDSLLGHTHTDSLLGHTHTDSQPARAY